jgi:hypothetical protein
VVGRDAHERLLLPTVRAAELQDWVRLRVSQLIDGACDVGERAGKQHVVVVEDHDPQIPGLADAPVPRRADAEIGVLAQNADLLCKVRQRAFGWSRRGVVDDDNLQFRPVLLEGRLDGSAQELRPIVRRDYG